MAKGLIPINAINSPRIIGPSVVELLESMNVEAVEDYTYTTRFTVDDESTRRRIRQVLAENVTDGEHTQEEVDAFLRVMDENNWNVSFLVDTY